MENSSYTIKFLTVYRQRVKRYRLSASIEITNNNTQITHNYRYCNRFLGNTRLLTSQSTYYKSTLSLTLTFSTRSRFASSMHHHNTANCTISVSTEGLSQSSLNTTSTTCFGRSSTFNSQARRCRGEEMVGELHSWGTTLKIGKERYRGKDRQLPVLYQKDSHLHQIDISII